jgi:hypothetical protein
MTISIQSIFSESFLTAPPYYCNLCLPPIIGRLSRDATQGLGHSARAASRSAADARARPRMAAGLHLCQSGARDGQQTAQFFLLVLQSGTADDGGP